MMLRTAGQNRKLVETQGRIKFDVKKICAPGWNSNCGTLHTRTQHEHTEGWLENFSVGEAKRRRRLESIWSHNSYCKGLNEFMWKEDTV